MGLVLTTDLASAQARVTVHAPVVRINPGVRPVPVVRVNPAVKAAPVTTGTVVRATVSAVLPKPKHPAVRAINVGSTAALLKSNPKAAAVKWATERMVANAGTAHREKTVGHKALKVVTGVSIKDIKKNGILGGKNSEARKVVNFFKKIF
jgi:hypothetical protein